VKIDPKSIGVGQYQHDVNQTKLKQRLDETVESAVNRVGVELNTASAALLGYVAGIGPSLAQARAGSLPGRSGCQQQRIGADAGRHAVRHHVDRASLLFQLRPASENAGDPG
jgi:uncharacterized protein